MRAFLRARLARGTRFGLHLTLGLAVAILAAWLFGAIAEDVVDRDPIVYTDLAISTWLQQHRTPALTPLMLGVTQLHSHVGIAALASLLGFYLYRRRAYYWLSALVVALPSGMILNALLKLIFQRPRPALDTPLLHLATYSFPSGHTLNATVFYGFLAAYLIAHRQRWATLAIAPAIALALIGLVAFSRVYLGVHFMSDVLASFVEGVAWLAICLTAVSSYRLHRLSLRPLAIDEPR